MIFIGRGESSGALNSPRWIDRQGSPWWCQMMASNAKNLSVVPVSGTLGKVRECRLSSSCPLLCVSERKQQLHILCAAGRRLGIGRVAAMHVVSVSVGIRAMEGKRGSIGGDQASSLAALPL
jgi:hypothetical protein